MIFIFEQHPVHRGGIVMADLPHNQSVMEGESVSVTYKAWIDPQLIPAIDWYKCHFNNENKCDWMLLEVCVILNVKLRYFT